MDYAAREGHIEVVKHCKKLGGINFDGAMCGAAFGGFMEIVKLSKE